MLAAWVILAIIAGVLAWTVLQYNSLIGLRNQVANGWKQIDVQLKRRHDLIPNLVNSARGIMQFEQETLQKVVQARSEAVGAQGIRDSASKELALSGALSRFFVVAEQYPQLRSTENVSKLQDELTSTENGISLARQFYNNIATQFNTAQQRFPANLIAGTFGFQPAELFEAPAPADREVPTVDLTLDK